FALDMGGVEYVAGVFGKILTSRTESLVGAAKLLSGDFAFKTAYATSDAETILSALENQRSRIGADVMILAALDGTIAADTLRPDARGGRLPFMRAIDAAAERGESRITSIVFLESRPYMMVTVPLLAPVPEAWICVGFLMENPFVAEFARQTLVDVTLLQRGAEDRFEVFATTLDGPAADRLPGALAASGWTADRSFALDMGGVEYVALAQPVAGAAGTPVIAVLQRSLAEALGPYRALRDDLALLFAGGVILTLALGVAIARSVTRPVLRLAEGARRVERGDYTQRIDIAQQDEIGDLAASFNEMVKGLEEKDRVRSLLGKVVSPEIAHRLLSAGVELGGEEREVTILFADVRNFTPLAESRSPQEVVSILNAYLTRMSRVVEENGGVVDKYVGDALMALFGAPIAHEDDPARAVSAALGMARALGELNAELRRDGLPALEIGIGVNTAEVVVGNMGSTTRLNYTAIGDGVNLASRLEGLTKVYGVPILVSEATRAKAPGFVYREIDRARVKGRAAAVTMHQPLGAEREVDAAALERLEGYHLALAGFRNREWKASGEALQALSRATPDERLYHLYMERIAGFAADPPPPDWDGAHSHTEK
ncbi:MAG TPA: adenylate/guanylate cyclase domain-containing protein, partial [Verrucomicrobiae bacterium]|nr:adenylate/guanylate cyclase domain-containing protein [Verrucomicrobiae bacterium]